MFSLNSPDKGCAGTLDVFRAGGVLVDSRSAKAEADRMSGAVGDRNEAVGDRQSTRTIGAIDRFNCACVEIARCD